MINNIFHHLRCEWIFQRLLSGGEIKSRLQIHPRTPAKTRRSSNAGTKLAHRLRRWPNIVPALGERPVFAGTWD